MAINVLAFRPVAQEVADLELGTADPDRDLGHDHGHGRNQDRDQDRDLGLLHRADPLGLAQSRELGRARARVANQWIGVRDPVVKLIVRDHEVEAVNQEHQRDHVQEVLAADHEVLLHVVRRHVLVALALLDLHVVVVLSVANASQATIKRC